MTRRERLAAPFVHPLDLLIEQERHTALRAAVAALPSRARRLLVLRYRCGLTVREIAEQYDGRTTAGVALHLQRIHRHLSKVVGGAWTPPHRGDRFFGAAVTTRNWNRRRARARAQQQAVA